MKGSILILMLFCCLVQAQPTKRLSIGTNISGLSDYMTEMPFVDLMHHCRTWMTGNITWVSGGSNAWDTGFIDRIPKDENGYPVSLPFHIQGAETLQVVHTIWAVLAGWPEGNYTLLYDGSGDFGFSGNVTVLGREPGRVVLRFVRPVSGDGQLGLTIKRSDSSNHVRNIRLLMPGTEQTYMTMPYYSEWFKRLQPFKVVRLMDWGHTNNWGHRAAWDCYDEDSDSTKVAWNERARLTDYTWATNKGVPYEVMIDLCNRIHADMWICVPYNAGDDFIRRLATLLKDNLHPSLKIYVEYSNENWNWMFGQAQWLNTFGCVKKGRSWPEGIVPYIQNCMDLFSAVFAGEMQRMVRVVGVQAAWLDASQRIVFNMRPGSYDAFSPAAYFGISASVDSALDRLGTSATVQDVVTRVRSTLSGNEKRWLMDQKKYIADARNIRMIYYEGGQHFTPTPFGEEPTYAQALLDVQRDTAMYNLYAEWFTFLEALSSREQEGLFVNFSFVGQRSARYGSWGILESVSQDTTSIPAPKYKAIVNYTNSTPTAVRNDSKGTTRTAPKLEQNYPNPFSARGGSAYGGNPTTTISYTVSTTSALNLKVYNLLGQEVATLFEGIRQPGTYEVTFDGKSLAGGVYFYRLNVNNSVETKQFLLLK